MPKGIYKRKPFTRKHRQNISNALIGRKLSRKHKEKMRQQKLGKKNPFYGRHHSEKQKRKWSKKRRGINAPYHDGFSKAKWKEKARKARRKFWFGNHHSEKTKKKMREIAIKNSNIKKIRKWERENPKLAYLTRSKNAKIMNIKKEERPTIPEKTLINLNIPSLWYCGDGELWVFSNGKNLNPDFKVHNQKKVIEVFGDYWHKGENPRDRINLYEQVGFECLVLWEHELKNLEDCKNRIKNFIRY